MLYYNLFLCYFFIADDDSGEKSVSVLLGGEESELTFVDIPSSEMSVSIKFESKMITNFSFYQNNKCYLWIQ